eukprot:TRINITY_DN38937_c0_g1_i1.p2 TRINITY_DN38937_c0_g1~~TRINITY_DN38937_c0_g1_i1.p2  ORF type:complete len:139 (+),score=28.94 TRINITY_DN38937_c0_g1_i1:66-482(+)
MGQTACNTGCCEREAEGGEAIIVKSSPAGLGDESGKSYAPREPQVEVGQATEVPVLFSCGPDGSTKTVLFKRRPLGFDFEKKAPLVVKRIKPGSHAAELGVKTGWTMMAINGVSLASVQDFQDLFGIVKHNTQSLAES